MNYFLRVVCILVPFVANAQYIEKKVITPLGFSGTFKHLVYGKDNGFVAVADNDCIYTSKDTCKTWIVKKAPIDSIQGIVMAPNGETGFIYNNTQIFKTEDGCKTWQKHKTNGIEEVLQGEKMKYLNLFFKNQDTLFFVTTNLVNGYRIYMSGDKGDNWKQVAEKLYGDSFSNRISSIQFVNPMHGYAFGIGYIAETIDGGVTWSKTMIDYETKFYSGIVVDGMLIQSYSEAKSGTLPQLENVIWYKNGVERFIPLKNGIIGIWLQAIHTTYDNGTSWDITSTSSTVPYVNFYDLSVLNDSVWILVGDNLTSYVSTDKGETWGEYIYGGGEGFNNIYCKNSEECFITGKTGRLFSTNDGGESWNIQDVHDGALYEIEFPTNDVGYVVGPQVLLKTTDGGQTWNKKKLKIVNAQYIDFFNENVGYLGYSSMQPTIHKTVDGGEYWESRDGCYNDTYRKNASGMTKFSFRNENEGVVCGTKTLLHTIDGGETWELKDCVPENTYPQSILSIGDKGWLLHTNNHLKDYSFDRFFFYDNDFNGTEIFSGTVSDESGNLQKINDSTYKFSYDTLDFISTDEGLTWNPIYTGMKGQRFFVNENLGYSITNNQIYKYCVTPTEMQMEIIKNDTYNYSVTPIYDGNPTTIVLYLTDESNIKHKITAEIEITNGKPITIEIPASLPFGSYTLYVEAQDKKYLSTNAGTIELEKSNAITGCLLQSPIYRVNGKNLYVNDTNAKLYTVLGTEIPLINGSVELKTGVYILINGNETQKIVIQ